MHSSSDAAFRARLFSCWPLVMFFRAGQRQMFAEPLSYTEHLMMMMQQQRRLPRLKSP